ALRTQAGPQRRWSWKVVLGRFGCIPGTLGRCGCIPGRPRKACKTFIAGSIPAVASEIGPFANVSYPLARGVDDNADDDQRDLYVLEWAARVREPRASWPDHDPRGGRRLS